MYEYIFDKMPLWCINIDLMYLNKYDCLSFNTINYIKWSLKKQCDNQVSY